MWHLSVALLEDLVLVETLPGFYISDPFLATFISSGPSKCAKGNKNNNEGAVTAIVLILAKLGVKKSKSEEHTSTKINSD